MFVKMKETEKKKRRKGKTRVIRRRDTGKERSEGCRETTWKYKRVLEYVVTEWVSF